MTLQDYLNMYKQPLTDSSVKAIKKLTEVAEEKKMKRYKQDHKKKKSDKMLITCKKPKKGNKNKKEQEASCQEGDAAD